MDKRERNNEREGTVQLKSEETVDFPEERLMTELSVLERRRQGTRRRRKAGVADE